MLKNYGALLSNAMLKLISDFNLCLDIQTNYINRRYVYGQV